MERVTIHRLYFNLWKGGIIWLTQINHIFHAGETHVKPIAQPFKHHNSLQCSRVIFVMCIYLKYISMNEDIRSESSFTVTPRSPDMVYVALSPRYEL